MMKKNAIGTISAAEYNVHTKPLYNMLKVEDIYKFHQLFFYHNLVYDKAPQSSV